MKSIIVTPKGEVTEVSEDENNDIKRTTIYSGSA